MSEELYIDGIGDVVITGMVIRFDLMVLDPSKRDDKNQPQPAVRQRVVMPLDGFLRAVQTLSATLPQLEKIGVIKKGQKAGAAAAVDPADVVEKALEAGLSGDGNPTASD